MYFTTSIAIVAGACVAYAVLHLSLALRGVSDRTRNILFALFASTYALSILFARSAYLAGTPDDFFANMRVSWFFGTLGFAFLVWYVGVYTAVIPRRFLWTLTAVFAAIVFADVFSPDLLFDMSTVVSTQTLPWGETVFVLGGGDAPLTPLALLASIAAVLYMVFANAFQLRGERSADGVALAVGIGWFIVTLVVEGLVTYGIVDFVVLNDFGFLGFLVAMSVREASRRAETERSLLGYQRNLEEMVADRTERLIDAQTELLAQAEDRAVTAERNRIAQELHDAVTQLLFSANLMAGSLPGQVQIDPEMAERTASEIQRITRGALAEMRTLLRELRPVTIINTELPTLVGQLAEGVAARHDIPAVVRLDLDAALSPDVHLTVYRIAQEAINNVAKHANASRLDVELVGDERHVFLSVADDGYGFETSDVSGQRMGLDIMRERAGDIGAELVIGSKPNVGTTVELSWSANSHD